MAASDLLVTKAGPGTISEAFIVGLPMILSGYIPGQETGNVHYVQKKKAGAYSRSSRRIARLAQEWMGGSSAVFQELVGNANRLARPNASLDIASDICRFL